MKEKIIQTLRDLQKYALEKNYVVSIFYHEEDSYLMRFANSAISLNTNEHLIRLFIDAYDGNKKASYTLITDINKIEEMKEGIDTVAEMVGHSQPLNYTPTVPVYKGDFIDEDGFDAELAFISNEERLKFFNEASKGLETDELKLSGIFSNGSNTLAAINTKSDNVLFFRTSDAQVTVVLAHSKLKWEVSAEQSAQKKSELNHEKVNRELNFLVARYQNDAPLQLELGEYDIVFGPAATADMVRLMGWVGYNGGSMKRGFSFIAEDQVGKKVFSDKFNLVDDPSRLETFPFKQDFAGIERKEFPLFENGVFKEYTWSQDDADEFGEKATGHEVLHSSIVLKSGEKDIETLEDLVNMPREKDILYVPFLHYMNLVNPSKGIFTATSRFGALLLKKDGSVAVPYNVRVTQSLLDVFGDKVAWMTKSSTVYNISQSYGIRNPTALVIPNFVKVDGLEISHSNTSY